MECQLNSQKGFFERFGRVFGILSFLVIIIGGGGQANAAEVYMSTTGTRAAGKSIIGDWKSANCYNNLQAAFLNMSSGDTLTIDDGVYEGASNTITGYIQPPSGTIGSFTVVRARNIPGNDGYPVAKRLNVELTGGIFAQNGGIPGTYIKFWGIRFLLANTYTGWNDLYFKQCAFVGTTDGNSSAMGLGGANCLVEDCVFYGKGRYKVLFYDYTNSGRVANNLCRRCVARQDWANGGACTAPDCRNPIATFVSYDNKDDAFINCIDIDAGSPAAYWKVNAGEYDGAFYAPKHAGSNMLVQGSISIGNPAGLGSSTGTRGVVYQDDAGVNIGGGIFQKDGATITRVDLVNINSGLFTYGSGQAMSQFIPMIMGIGSYEGVVSVSNSILLNLITPTKNLYYLYTADHINPFNTPPRDTAHGGTMTNVITTDPMVNGLLYPVRIEIGSILKTAGSSGNQVGAQIVMKLGKDGAFKGDADWNTEQGPLWPWPLEEWIKAEMASMPDTIGGNAMPSPTRGFASPMAKRLDGVNPVTLTSYIWESLGNPIPADIYGVAP